MNIQNVEIKTGLTKRMIRHYEEFGLLQPKRNENGYREYTEDEVNQLLCIKALRELGFSLSEVARILQDGKTEETFRRHLNQLLVQQQEESRQQQNRIQAIRKVLKSNEINDRLLERIAGAKIISDHIDGVDGLNDFLNKHHVVRGQIQPVIDFSKVALLGYQHEFTVVDITYITYGGLFEENVQSRASISICKELYAYCLLFSDSADQFGAAFHQEILQQFNSQWAKVSWPLTTKFDALTEDIPSLEKIFSPFDLAVVITAANSDGDKINLVIPGQPLIVYLSHKSGLQYNHKDWLEP